MSEGRLQKVKELFRSRHAKICSGTLTETNTRFLGNHIVCDSCDSFYANGNWGVDRNLMLEFIDQSPAPKPAVADSNLSLEEVKA